MRAKPRKWSLPSGDAKPEEVLRIKEGATQEEVRRAYRERVKEYTKNSADEEAWKQLHHAWAVLTGKVTPSAQEQAYVSNLLGLAVESIISTQLETGVIPEQRDLIQDMKKALDQLVKDHEKEIVKVRKQKLALESIANRVSLKNELGHINDNNDNNNSLRDSIQLRVLAKEQELERLQQHIKMLKLARTIIDNYNFKVDPLPIDNSYLNGSIGVQGKVTWGSPSQPPEEVDKMIKSIFGVR